MIRLADSPILCARLRHIYLVQFEPCNFQIDVETSGIWQDDTYFSPINKHKICIFFLWWVCNVLKELLKAFECVCGDGEGGGQTAWVISFSNGVSKTAAIFGIVLKHAWRGNTPAEILNIFFFLFLFYKSVFPYTCILYIALYFNLPYKCS